MRMETRRALWVLDGSLVDAGRTFYKKFTYDDTEVKLYFRGLNKNWNIFRVFKILRLDSEMLDLLADDAGLTCLDCVVNGEVWLTCESVGKDWGTSEKCGLQKFLKRCVVHTLSQKQGGGKPAAIVEQLKLVSLVALPQRWSGDYDPQCWTRDE